MPNRTDGEAAVSALNGSDLGGRNLEVSEARPKSEAGRPGGGDFTRRRPGGQKRRW
jgi:hypothetical protein